MGNKLIINLAKLESTVPVGEDELIFKGIFGELCETIVYKVEDNVKKCTQIENHIRKCNQWNNTCFFINGGRGSGKSTLLRAVGNRLESDCRSMKIHRLASVDPTELAETESFFIHILSLISKELADVDTMHRDNLRKKSSIEKAYELFMKMATGLKLIGQKNSQSLYELDAQFFLTESVEQCTSSADLKNCFHQLIDYLCDILNIKAFYVTIDDADMNFNKCREILETIRTYMLSPRLAFIFAGDLKLYSLVIRAMQIGHFGQISLQYDNEREEQRKRLLDQLEEQYLIKMFPNENRINLSNFSEALNSNTLLICGDENKQVPIMEFLYDCISCYVPLIARDRVINYLGGLPTRTSLQLLKYWDVHKNEERAISKGLLLTFSSSLIKYGVNHAAITSNDYGVLLKSIVQQLGNNSTMYVASLIPQDGAEDKDHVIFYLNAETVYQTQALHLKLRYLFRTFPAIRYPELKSYINKVADEKEWAALCTVAVDPAVRGSGSKRYANGVIRLLKEKGNPDTIDLSVYLKHLCEQTIKSLVNPDKNNANESLKYCLAINHSFCKIYEKRESGIYLSVYCFMALVEKCMSIQVGVDDAKEKERIKNCITLCQTMPMAFKNVGDNDKSDAPSDINETETDKGFTTHFKNIQETSKYNDVLETIVNEVYDWLKIKPEKYITNPSQLSDCWQRIMSRYETATENAALSSKDPDKIVKAGNLFNKYLNAIITAIDESLNRSDNTSGKEFRTQDSLGAYLKKFPLVETLLQIEGTQNESLKQLQQETDKINVGAKTEVDALKEKSRKENKSPKRQGGAKAVAARVTQESNG